MPKKVHDLVDKLLADPDFYPQKSQKEQEAIAWAIAYSKHKKHSKRKKKASFDEFNIVDSMLGYGRKLEANNKFAESDKLIQLAQEFINDNSDNSQQGSR
jgi:hypothetical protein